MPPQLLLRSKWFRARNNLKVGDYVIILDPGLKGKSAPRGVWEHAIVSKTFPGNDNLVRKVELRLSGSTLPDETHSQTLPDSNVGGTECDKLIMCSEPSLCSKTIGEFKLFSKVLFCNE